MLGDLALQARNLYGSQEGEEEQRVPQVSPPQSLEFGSSSDNERILGLDSASVDSNMSPKQVNFVTHILSHILLIPHLSVQVSSSTNYCSNDKVLGIKLLLVVKYRTFHGFYILGMILISESWNFRLVSK